jgi:hypothetical protein
MVFEPRQPVRIGGRYEVITELGRGGMAAVYRARDPGTGRELALKQLLPPSDAGKAREVVALFEREFYTLAQLSHPGVIEVYDFGNDAGRPYYTMQLLDGGDLSERGPWPYAKACELIAGVCSALSLLHSRRLVHRDISPRNVRCTQAGAAKLIDFGAMAPMGQNAQIVGTPSFIAPEVLHQLSLDGRTDLFSLGATLYYAITGRSPFAARNFAELRELWRMEPVPPSQLTAAIPPALDALLLSMLRIDPAQRPRSAFEVMQRLCAIAGIECAESAEVTQAYLSTPTLVARDAELVEVRAIVARAGKGHGGGLSIEGAAGLGRSRFLDACVLEAKLLAANVVRVSGGAASSAPFSSALKLAEHLLEADSELAIGIARDAGVLDVLFTVGPDDARLPRLRAQSELQAERHVLQAAFTSWLQAAAQRHPLVIVADDAQRLDHATLGLFAGLANHAAARPLVVLISVLTPVTSGVSPALDVLRSHCKPVPLTLLTRAQTESLFGSVFAGAPHVRMLSDRVHELAGGRPRDSMALASHLLDIGRIRYADGSWTLPAELTVTDLPADAAEALRLRVASLPELARRLAELQALALPGAWTRADYAELAGPNEVRHVDDALHTLLRLAIFVSDDEAYTLAHQGVRACLVSRLDDAKLAVHHLALAEHCARRVRFGLPEVHHLLLAGEEQRALDRFAELRARIDDRADLTEVSGMTGREIAVVYESGYALAVKHKRRPREIFELLQSLTALSVVADTALYARYGQAFAEQLERDSGLMDYRALDPSLAPAARLQEAIGRAIARYEATPEAERVFRFDEAIKFLARYVSVVIVQGARTRNSRLLAATPTMLEPFAVLSPVIDALWQNAVAAYEMNFGGQPARARDRVLAVYARLGELQGEDLRFASVIRNAVALAIGSTGLLIGEPSAPEWLAIAEKDPMQVVTATYFRRLRSLMQRDVEEAERLRRHAEVLAVQASGRQMFPPPLRYELGEQAQLGDLAAVKHVVDQISDMAVDEPGWESQACVARGVYQHMRGDLAAAEHAYGRCLELSDPARDPAYPDMSTWAPAVASYMSLLVDLGRLDRAYELGKRALEQCEEMAIDFPAVEIARELALVEAKLGLHAAAARRIDALIASREGVVEFHRTLDYEVRARVAIEARDSETALRYANLMRRESSMRPNAAMATRQTQLFDHARRAGLEVDVPASAFESSVLGDSLRPERQLALTRAATLLYDARESNERAQRSLEALCQITRAGAGVLYVARASGLQRAAELNLAVTPELDERIGLYWLQQLHGGDMTALTVEASDAVLPATEVFCDHSGREFQFMLLKCVLRETLLYVGVAVLATESGAPPRAAAWELANALSSRLLELGDVTGVFPG